MEVQEVEKNVIGDYSAGRNRTAQLFHHFAVFGKDVHGQGTLAALNEADYALQVAVSDHWQYRPEDFFLHQRRLH